MVKPANKKMKALVSNAGAVNVTAKQSPGKGEKRKSDVVAEPNDNVVKNKRKKKAKKNKNGILTAQEDVTTSNIQVKTENQNEGSEKKKKREKRKKKLVKQEYEPEAKKVLLENNLEEETESNDEKNESDHMGSEGQDGENESDAEVNGSDHMDSENQDGENESDAEVNGSDAGETSEKEEDRKIIGLSREQKARTIIIENVPETVNEDKLISIFSTFGKVESVYLRAVYHSNEPNLHMWPKGVAEITKKFYLVRKILVAYIRFEQLSSVFPSLQMNTYILEGHTLHIKRFWKPCFQDNKFCVFVKNLSPSTRHGELRQLFADCGSIFGMHIVRHKMTGVCQGIGYIYFESTDGVELALAKDKCIFKDRLLKVHRYVEKEVTSSNRKGKRQPKPSHLRQKNYKKANNTNELSSQGETIGDSGKAKKAKVGPSMDSIIEEVLSDGPQFQRQAKQEPMTPK